jgi:hypothetical protein
LVVFSNRLDCGIDSAFVAVEYSFQDHDCSVRTSAQDAWEAWVPRPSIQQRFKRSFFLDKFL